MELLELAETQHLSREQAAGLLRHRADELSRQNSLSFQRNGKTLTVRVPRQVEMEVEIEIEKDESSIEIEISW